MTPTAILSTLAAAGVELSCRSGRLRFLAPIGAYTTDLRALVDQHRKELLLCMCWQCGSTDYRDVVIHGGASARRDCARCGRFIGFPVWNGDNYFVDDPGGIKAAQM